MANPDITVERLRELVRYEPDTGIFYWRRTTNNMAVKDGVVGHLAKSKYVTIRLNYKSYLAHRLAFLYMTGRWPNEHIDHIDHNPSNNRFSNLREATNSENMHNRKGVPADNTTGYMGISFVPRRNRYHAYMTVRGAKVLNKYFHTLEAAVAARKDAENVYDVWK